MTDIPQLEEESLENLKNKYEFQQIMLEDALKNVEKKNLVLEEINYELEEKKFELEQFIYRLNHDFKSPVASIKGLIEILELDQKSINLVLEKLKETVSRLDALIANMSYFYNTTQVTNEKTSLLSVYNSLIAKFKNDIIKNKIDVKSNFEPNTKNILVLNRDFEAVFGCLISNAVNYIDTQKEKHLLEVNVGIKGGGALLEIVFKDNGIGIDKDFQNEIFKIFVRGCSQSKGAGLGLYILYKIIKNYKGIINVESDTNKGMALQITIPLQNLN